MTWRAGRSSVAVVLLASIAVWGSVSTAGHHPTIEYIPFDPGDPISAAPFTVSASTDGRYLTVATGSAGWYHVDVNTGALTDLQLQNAQPSDDGTHVTGVAEGDPSQVLRREDLATGDVTIVPPNPLPPGLDLEGRWFEPRAGEPFGGGRYVLITATSGDNFTTQYFVWDTIDEQLVTSIDGLPVGAGRIVDVRVRDDGAGLRLEYLTFSTVGAPIETIETLTIPGLVSTAQTVDSKVHPGIADVRFSPSREWAVYARADSVVPGVYFGRPDDWELVRWHLPSDDVERIPIDRDPFVSHSTAIFDDGSVGYVSAADLTRPELGEQVMHWTGDGSPAQLTVTPSGGAPEAGVTAVSAVTWATDGSFVHVISWARDLTDDPKQGDTFARRHIYRITLARPDGTPARPGVSGPAAATETATRCDVSITC